MGANDLTSGNGGKYMTTRDFIPWVEKISSAITAVNELNDSLQKVVSLTHKIEMSLVENYTRLDTRLEGVESRLDVLDTRVSNLEDKQRTLVNNMTSMESSMKLAKDKLAFNGWIWKTIIAMLFSWLLGLSYFLIKVATQLGH